MIKSKKRTEVISEIGAHLSGIPDSWKDILIDSILSYPKTRPSLKKFPSFVNVHKTKPQFFLDDGDLLYKFAIKFQIKDGRLSGDFTPTSYGGSADSILWHVKDQLHSGGIAPENCVGVFITEHASSGIRIWSVDVWCGEQIVITQKVKNQIEKRDHKFLIIKNHYPEDAKEIIRRVNYQLSNFKFACEDEYTALAAGSKEISFTLPTITQNEEERLIQRINDVIIGTFAPSNISIKIVASKKT